MDASTYASSLSSIYAHSPIRGAKRTRSATFSGDSKHASGGGAIAALSTRNLHANYLPTPPLSASSSCSSNSSSTSFESSAFNGLGSFATFDWKPEHAGGPMQYTISPENMHQTPATDVDSKSQCHLTAFKELNRFRQRNSVGTPIPLPLPQFDQVKPAMINDHLPPAAPAIHDINPASEVTKPWPQQDKVEGLIGVSMLAIDSIWPNSGSPRSPTQSVGSAEQVLPLRYFIQETLRRSRSNDNVLQIALYYLHRARGKIRERVAKAAAAKERFQVLATLRQEQQKLQLQAAYPSPPSSPITDEFTHAAAEVLSTSRDPVICGRRMFLASLICASKFLLDRTYSNKAWSRLSGLPVAEINLNERHFLAMLDYRLYIGADLMRNWMSRLRKLTDQQGLSSTASLPRTGLERTQSEIILTDHSMEEVHAGYNQHGAPESSFTHLARLERANSSAHISSKYPDLSLNPRGQTASSRPAVSHNASFGLLALSRSSNAGRSRRTQSSAHASPLRRSYSGSCSTKVDQSGAVQIPMQMAY